MLDIILKRKGYEGYNQFKLEATLELSRSMCEGKVTLGVTAERKSEAIEKTIELINSLCAALQKAKSELKEV